MRSDNRGILLRKMPLLSLLIHEKSNKKTGRWHAAHTHASVLSFYLIDFVLDQVTDPVADEG
jgi:hypothetical protein